MENTIALSEAERAELERRVAERWIRAEVARRARGVLLPADGQARAEACLRLECGRGFVNTWRQRFLEGRLSGMFSRHRGRIPGEPTAKLEARILEATRHAPPDGSTRRSTRMLGAHVGVSHLRVKRVWAKHRLQPHRVERYLTSDDPDIERKAAGVIGLYLNPPEHAAVFCVVRRLSF